MRPWGLPHAHGGVIDDMAGTEINVKSRARKGNLPVVAARKCSQQMGPPRALLIDGNSALCESISTALSTIDACRMEQAASLEAGLRRAVDGEVDVLLPCLSSRNRVRNKFPGCCVRWPTGNARSP